MRTETFLDGRVTLRIGDVREALAAMPDASVNCVVTSPPYFGLRDYGVDGQIGLEATPSEFVDAMVAVFQEVRRVLRSDGTCWINLGDSYASKPNGPHGIPSHASPHVAARTSHARRSSAVPAGLKHKDLMMVPARVAIALCDDGWYLRQDIIWHKPNPMPESVRDRCTKSHEHVFLLTKSARYWYDAEGIRESTVGSGEVGTGVGWGRLDRTSLEKDRGRDRIRKRGTPPRHAAYESSDQSGLDEVGRGFGRNARDVWTIATQPFSEAHFATFPPELPRRCILAGCPKDGVVLDPFGGAGTTALVALRQGRRAELIEINPEYAAMARRRIETEWRVPQKQETDDFGPLFAGGAA